MHVTESLQLPGGGLRLVPLRPEHVEDAALVAKLGAWRAQHMDMYPTQFTVTDERTRTWLRDIVLASPVRAMFLLETPGGEVVGHLGLDRLDPANRLGELSNAMIGDRAAAGPGAMEAAIRAIVVWACDTFDLDMIGARPFTDNLPSLRMLRRSGFADDHEIPLRRHAAGDRVEYRPCAPGDDAPPDRVWLMTWNHRRPDEGPIGISGVGLGTASTGPAQRGAAADEARAATFATAVARHVRWVDTAPAYGLGHVERQLGALLAEVPAADRPRLVSKCGLQCDEAAQRAVPSDPAGFRDEVLGSLHRLGADRLDLLVLHRCPEDPAALAAAWDALAACAAAGLATRIGLSSPTAAGLAACHATRRVDAVQLPCSAARPGQAGDALAAARRLGVPVVAHGALELGALTDDPRHDPPPRDRRRRADALGADGRARVDAARPRLAEIAASVPCSLPELAAAWVLEEPGVVAVAVGASTPAQVAAVTSATQVRLGAARRAAVADALA